MDFSCGLLGLFTELCTTVLSPDLEQREGDVYLNLPQVARLLAVPVVNCEQEWAVQERAGTSTGGNLSLDFHHLQFTSCSLYLFIYFLNVISELSLKQVGDFSDYTWPQSSQNFTKMPHPVRSSGVLVNSGKL